MDIIKERKIHNAKSSIEATRRLLAELQGFGWQPSQAIDQPLKDFVKFAGMLDETTQAIRGLKPKADKSHERELSGLLERESYYVESLEATARAAREGLRMEQLAFFQARDELMNPMREAVEEADKNLQAAFESFAGAMQKKWRAILAMHQVRQTLFAISHEHQASPLLAEPEMKLSAPFKGKIGTWYAFVSVHFARLTEILSGAENWDPKDAAERAFTK